MSSDHVIGGRYEDKKLIASIDRPAVTTGKEYLVNTQVKSLFPANRTKILSVDKNDSVATAFKILTENHILSVPVNDPKASQYIGFVDILDVIVFCLKDVKDEEIQTNNNLEALVASHHILEKATCGEVAGFSGRNPFYPIDATAPLLTALQLMAKNNAHRLPVVESSGELVSLVSQSLMVHAICNNSRKFSVMSKTVQELGLGLKEVLTIREDQNAFEAFRLIHAKKVLGIAVVDNNGVLTGNISASDLRQISRADSHIFARLLVPAKTFIDAIPQKDEELIPGPFCVQVAATVEEVIEKIVMTKSHRVYVVDSNGKPIGVVSLVDLLKVVLENL